MIRISVPDGVVAALALATLVHGCAPRPLVERAIRARGGPLATLVREIESDVYAGFPGTWRSRTTFMFPDHYAWTVETAAEATHYLFDGHAVRGFVGGREVSVDAGPGAPLRTQARFFSVVQDRKSTV